MNFLQGRIFGIPVWLVGAGVIGAGIGIYLIIKNRNGSSSSGGVLGQNTQTATDPNLDPNTGIPYSVEEATDPNTGLPVYLTLLNQGSGMPSSTPTQAPGDVPPPGPPAPSGPPGPIPPQPAPLSTGVTAGATSGQVTPNNGSKPGPIPPQPGPGGGGGAKPGFAPHPPQPAKGTAVPSAYAFQSTDWWPYDLMAAPWKERE